MEIRLKTADLKKSESNVRAGHSKEDIKTMADSIANRGIINPPSVAKNGDGRYEVIAGQLRVAGAIAAGLDEIDCIDVTKLTPEQRVDMSLSENVHRRKMSEIELFRAFDKLFRTGMSVEQIGARFDKKEREVQQLLAIGGLPKKILDAAERDDIGGRTLQALAVAPKGEVRRYLKLKISDRPRDWEIQEWLAGADGMYMEKFAIFDVEKYTGGKFTDLFGDEDEVWFTDGSMFMELQTAALDAKLAEFEKKGWKCQQVDYWQGYAYTKTAKKKGGTVIYARDPRSGSVEFHVGYKRNTASGAAPKAKAAKGEKVEKPDTSKAFDHYMAETRHYAVAAEMADDETSGLVATIILLVKQCDNISIRNQGSMVKGTAQLDSICASANYTAVAKEFAATMKCMGIKPDAMMWDIDIAKVAKKLQEYDTKSLIQMVGTIMARNWTLSGDGKDSDAIGKALGLTSVREWEVDDAFLDGITNKDTLLKIAKLNHVTVNSKMTLKVIRAKLKAGIPADYRPEWLNF